jgi:hypothetical protein
VYFLTDASVMHPGLGVAKTAAAFADKLHPGRPKAASGAGAIP